MAKVISNFNPDSKAFYKIDKVEQIINNCSVKIYNNITTVSGRLSCYVIGVLSRKLQQEFNILPI